MKIYNMEVSNNSNLIFEVDLYDEIDEIAFNMMNNNKINNLIPFSLSTINGKKEIIYNISDLNRIDLRNMDERKMNKFIKSTLEINNETKRYLLDFNNIFLSTEYIYELDDEIYYIYIPFVDGQFSNDITKFIKNVILESRFDYEQSKEYLLKLLKLLDGGLTNRSFKIFTQEKNIPQIKEEITPYIVENVEVEIPTNEETEKKVSKILKKLMDKFTGKGGEINIDASKLVDVENNNEILIDKFLKIGSDTNYADYIIDKDGIERVHVLISRKNEKIYIEDNNTIPGTYVNKKRLLPKVARKLEVNDEISLGNKKTIFIVK